MRTIPSPAPVKRYAAAAVTLLAVTALSACGDGDKPTEAGATFTPTGHVESPPPTTEPATDPLTDPPDKETARQFIRRWIALSDDMQTSGSTSGFLGVAGPDCKTCAKVAETVESIYAAGGSITGVASTVDAVQHDNGAAWIVSISSAGSSIIRSAGAPPEELPSGHYKLKLYIAKFDGAWVLGEYVEVP